MFEHITICILFLIIQQVMLVHGKLINSIQYIVQWLHMTYVGKKQFKIYKFKDKKKWYDINEKTPYKRLNETEIIL